MTASPPRDQRLDVARGLGMVFVLYGHSLEALFLRHAPAFTTHAFRQWEAIYAFHMPLFFVISGIAHKSLASKTGRQVASASLGLVLLAYANHLVGAVLRLGRDLHEQVSLTAGGVARLVVKPLLVGVDPSLNMLWFLISIAIVQLLAHAWLQSRTPLARAILVGVCALSFVAGTSYGWSIPNYFYFRTWFWGLFFFLGGYAWAQRRTFPSAWWALPCLAAVVALARLNEGCSFEVFERCGIDLLRGEFGVWMYAGQYGFLPLFALTACLGCVGVLSLAGQLRWRGLSWLGRNSLQLMIVNAYFLEFVVTALSRYDASRVGALGYVAILLATLVTQVLLARLFGPLLNRLQAQTRTLADRLVNKAWSLAPRLGLEADRS